mgnify:CR=1 FL=1
MTLDAAHDPEKPWRKVKTSDVREAIKGTGLETIVHVIGAATEPELSRP